MNAERPTDDENSHSTPAGSGGAADDTGNRTDPLDIAIQKLAKARGTDVGEVSARFSEEMILKAPNSFSNYTSSLRALEINVTKKPPASLPVRLGSHLAEADRRDISRCARCGRSLSQWLGRHTIVALAAEERESNGMRRVSRSQDDPFRR